MSKLQSLSSNQAGQMDELRSKLGAAMGLLGESAKDFGDASPDQRNALWPQLWNSAQAAYKARLAVKKLAEEQALS